VEGAVPFDPKNKPYDLRFYGRRYGILAEKTSPAWQFTLLDSSFDGQRDAAIRGHEAALTLANTEIRNTPVGIEIDRGYGHWLWGKEVRFENLSKAALVISKEIAQVGRRAVFTSASRNITYSGLVGQGGAVRDPHLSQSGSASGARLCSLFSRTSLPAGP
jgi:hypothetical protein